MKAYECGKEAEHHFTARFISDPKELHRTFKKMNLHAFKAAVKPKKDLFFYFIFYLVAYLSSYHEKAINALYELV